jgi:2',3'-cyclic-nucleotide 2'-phosphodiesterase (5'-nucleotidase family)
MKNLLAAIFLVSLLGCHSSYTIQSSEKKEYVLSDSTNNLSDTAINNFISPYRDKMQGEMSAVIAESETALEKSSPEGKLGDFVADACMREAYKLYYPSDGKQIDFAFFNNGGLRRALPQGKITRGDVFELMPFENELVVLHLDGNDVKKIFNFIAAKNGAPVSGTRFRILGKTATDIFIQGQKLDTARTYKALTSDYIANGGESFDFLVNVPRDYVNLKVRDAIMQDLTAAGKENKKLSVNLDGRISNAQ